MTALFVFAAIFIFAAGFLIGHWAGAAIGYEEALQDAERWDTAEDPEGIRWAITDKGRAELAAHRHTSNPNDY